MMKLSTAVAIIFFINSCREISENNPASSPPEAENASETNDTSWTELNFSSTTVEGLDFRHIRFGDSLRDTMFKIAFVDPRTLAKKGLNGEHPEHENLVFTKSKDTVIITFLYPSTSSEQSLIPDSIFQTGNIVYLKEKGTEKRSLSGHPHSAEKIIYRFRLKDSLLPIAFRHSWELDCQVLPLTSACQKPGFTLVAAFRKMYL